MRIYQYICHIFSAISAFPLMRWIELPNFWSDFAFVLYFDLFGIPS
jgi:hypothetical protein